MSESFTRHAAQRAQQRCVPPLIMEWLHVYGQRAPAGAGAECLFFDKASRRRLQRAFGGWVAARMECKLNAYAVVAADGQIITTGYRSKRLPR